jgi:hypothetical protein
VSPALLRARGKSKPINVRLKAQLGLCMPEACRGPGNAGKPLLGAPRAPQGRPAPYPDRGALRMTAGWSVAAARSIGWEALPSRGRARPLRLAVVKKVVAVLDPAAALGRTRATPNFAIVGSWRPSRGFPRAAGRQRENQQEPAAGRAGPPSQSSGLSRGLHRTLRPARSPGRFPTLTMHAIVLAVSR